VTSGALSAIQTLGKLAIMRIGCVTVGALRECDLLLKIAASMTLDAPNCSVFSQERELGFGVIEVLAQTRRELLPSAGVVAGLAGLRKHPVVWIAMTVRALPKWNGRVAWLVILAGRVALFAHNLSVHARQRVSSFRMIELLRTNSLPIC
jgi:hypothetical protein